MKKKYFVIGLIIILIDQLLKYISINKNLTIIPNILNITYTENVGAAFGIGSKNIVMIVSIIIIIGIVFYLFIKNKEIENYISFILILSGSIGNLIDRIFRGYVIDFISVNFLNFPNFNLADICITIGISIILFDIIKKMFNKRTEK